MFCFRYHKAGAKAKVKVLELLTGLSFEMQSKINVLVFASMLLVIAEALFARVRLGSHIIIKLLQHSLHIYNNKSSGPLVAFLTRKLLLSLTVDFVY